MKLPYSNFLLTLSAILLAVCIIILPSTHYIDFADASQTTPLILLLFVISLLLVVNAIVALLSARFVFAISLIDIVLLALCLYVVLNRYLFRTDVAISIQVYELVSLIICYFILKRFPVKYYIFIIAAIVAGGIVQEAHGILQLMHVVPVQNSNFKITGNFFNPGPYAGFLSSTGVLAAGLYVYRKELEQHVHSNRLSKWLFTYLPVCCLAGAIILLPALRSRAAWIALGTGCLILFNYKYKWQEVLMRIIPSKILLVLIAIILVAVAAYGIYNYKTASANGRLLIYKVCVNMIGQRPLTGIGFDRFQAHYMEAQTNRLNNQNNSAESLLADNTYYAFSELLQLLVENGIIGLLLVVALVVCCFRIKIKGTDFVLKLLAMAVLAAIFSFSCFSYPSYILPIKLVAIVMLGLLACIDSAPVYSGSIRFPLVKVVGAFFLIGVAGCAVYTARQMSAGFTNWRTAQVAYNYEEYANSITAFTQAYPVLKDHGDFTMQYGKALAMAEKYKEAIAMLRQSQQQSNYTITQTTLGDCYTAVGDYDAAARSYQAAIDMIPGRFYSLYLLVNLYNTTGQQQKAYELAKRILDKPIKIPSKAINEIKIAAQTIIDQYEGKTTGNDKRVNPFLNF